MAKLLLKGLMLLAGLLASFYLTTLIGKEITMPRWAELYSGYLGSGLMLVGMLYSIRKRWLKGWGHLRYWLIGHEYLSLIGALLISFHAAMRFRAAVPVTTLILMAVVVTSGFLGREIYRELVRYKANQYISGNSSTRELVFKRLKLWRVWHVQLSLSLLVFAALHLVLVGYYGGLK